MTISPGAAILGGAVLLSGAILIVFRWELASSSHPTTTYRLDRWTGTVAACQRAGMYEVQCAPKDDWDRLLNAPKGPWDDFKPKSGL